MTPQSCKGAPWAPHCTHFGIFHPELFEWTHQNGVQHHAVQQAVHQCAGSKVTQDGRPSFSVAGSMISSVFPWAAHGMSNDHHQHTQHRAASVSSDHPPSVTQLFLCLWGVECPIPTGQGGLQSRPALRSHPQHGTVPQGTDGLGGMEENRTPHWWSQCTAAAWTPDHW